MTGLRVLIVLPIREGLNFVVSPDLGILYLGTALRSSGFDVTLLDCPKENFSFRDFKRFITERHFDVIGFRCFSRDHNYVNHHINIARQVNPKAVTLLGGPHPSALPDFALRSMPNLDFSWSSEAEEGLPRLLSCVAEHGRLVPEACLAEIPGLTWRRAEGTIAANAPAYTPDLDAHGLPAWDLIRPDTYPGFVWGGQHYPIVTTRGCPYPCTYCNTPGLSGRKLRHRSVEHVIEELRWLKQKYGLRNFSVMDDEFTLDRKYTMRLCESLINSGLGLKFDCPVGVRLDSLTPEIVKVMEEAGCTSIAVGIESGSERIQGLIRKKTSVGTIREKARMVSDWSRISMVGYFMIGFADETEQEVTETIELARELPLKRANFNIVIPIPGTALFEDLLRSGRVSLDAINWDELTSDKIAFDRQHLNHATLLRLQKRAYLRFYVRPSIVWDVGRETLRNRAVFGASLKKLKMLLTRRSHHATPLYLREAIV